MRKLRLGRGSLLRYLPGEWQSWDLKSDFSASSHFSTNQGEAAKETPGASRQLVSGGGQGESFPARVQILVLSGKLLIMGSLQLM